MRVQRQVWWWAVFGLSLGAPALAQEPANDAPANAAASEASFLGRYEMTGNYYRPLRSRNTAVELVIERDAEGRVSVSRTGRYTAKRYRNVPPFTWTSREARVEGAALKVTFRLDADGKPVDTIGLAGALTGGNAGSGAPAAVNVFEASYTVADGQINEEVVNTTRKAKEDWWRTVRTRGLALGGRLKLGGEAVTTRAGSRHVVVIPTDGTLTITVAGGGGVRVQDPSGQVVASGDAGSVVVNVPHQNPTLGSYVAVVDSASQGATLRASFVQNGQIDPRIRPWSSHTYYPIYDGTTNNMFHEGGPLEKFDKALQLEGRESARTWEMGGEYRTSFDFAYGHRIPASSPRESSAEKDWYADLDGDGLIETETDKAAYFKRFDSDGDEKITSSEASKQFELGAVANLWRRYDGNGDGKIAKTEIFANFVTKHDQDGSGDLDRTEFEAGVRQDYANVITDRAKAALERFMNQDGDGDGVLVADEVRSPGAYDFMDSSDVDGDFNSFFDRDNIQVTTNDGQQHFGNRLDESGDTMKLYKGRKQDELVAELAKADVKKVQRGVADGDLDDSYSVGWWGHCNAWSMASIIFRKPAGPITVEGVELSVRDQKGILVEAGMGDTEDSTFWWETWGKEIPPGRYAAGFHRQLHRWLRVEQKGMMADMDLKNPLNNLNFQVWNYPILGYTATMTEADGDDPNVLDVQCSMTKGSYSDEDSESSASVSYRLHFQANGGIREDDDSRTTWTKKSGEDLVYIRYLIHPYRITGAGSSGNPKVTLERLQKLFGENLKYNRIEDLPAEASSAEGLPNPVSGNGGQ